jgi:plastocyanin
MFMLKNTLIFGLLFFLFGMMVFSMIPESFAEAYWGNLKVDIDESYRFEGPKTDVIIIEAELTNNDNDPIDIFSFYIQLEDSKHREFDHANYRELIDKGHNVTERKCPYVFSIDINPGISEDLDICFEVPKDHVEFTLSFYEHDPDNCRSPTYGSCQEKHTRIIVNAPSPKTSSSTSSSSQYTPPTTSSNVNSDITINFGTDSPGCETSNSCFTPYRLTVGKGSTVSWYNADTAAHTVTSGSAGNGPDGSFDSGMMMSKSTYSATFNRDGSFNYFCLIHPWMEGQVIIQRGGTIVGETTPQFIPQDTTPPKILKPTDIEINAESQYGAKVIFKVLTIDDTDSIVNPSCNRNSGSLFETGETKVTCNAMDSSGNRAIPVSFTVTVIPLKSAIPDWVKNVASYWCDNAIDDTSFVEGIQYLIDNNIITVSAQSSTSNSQEIPDWIKNNACWWSSGAISDDEFATGIEYLVKQGIISV